jgi:hypothetical protein
MIWRLIVVRKQRCYEIGGWFCFHCKSFVPKTKTQVSTRFGRSFIHDNSLTPWSPSGTKFARLHNPSKGSAVGIVRCNGRHVCLLVLAQFGLQHLHQNGKLPSKIMRFTWIGIQIIELVVVVGIATVGGLVGTVWLGALLLGTARSALQEFPIGPS